MIRLTVEQVIKLHKELIEATGGSPGFLNKEMLYSALSSPFQTFDGEDVNPTIEEKAAKLAYFLISNHCFVDGNKRIGIYVMLVFLELNNILLAYTQRELIDLGLGTANGKLNDTDILAFINEHKKGASNVTPF